MPESTAGQTDLTEHGGQRQAHPGRLFAVPHPLQRPADGDDRAVLRHSPGQPHDVVGGDARDRRRPPRRLGHTVVRAEKISLEAFITGAVRAQELSVGEALGGEYVREREHDRHIGTGHRREPLTLAVDVIAQRRERHDPPPTGAVPSQRISRRMGGGPAVVDRRVLQREPTEADEKFGVLDDDLPRGRAFEQVIVRSDDTRHDHAGRAETVGMPGKRVSAKEVQEPVHLALGMVEPARAGPTVGTTEDGLVPVHVDHAAQLAGEQLGQLVP
nr:hypothetical protein CPGR_03530 [Mycolicibacterium malmesburyense]